MKDTYSAEEIAKLAYVGQELGIVSDLADYHLHTCLGDLFRRYRDGLITQDEAAGLKARRIAAWRNWKETAAAYQQFAEEFNDNIRAAAGIEIEKAETEHDALIMACDVVGKLTGDAELPKRIAKKFMQ